MDLHDPDLWQRVSDAIAALVADETVPYLYDLGDASHRLDVVQLVCQALDKATDQSDGDERG